ncbi:M23 family metallopeptidase, partial [Streptomyces sp. NPDC057540]
MLRGLSRRPLTWLLAAAAALLPALAASPPAVAAATGSGTACPSIGFVSQPFHPGHNGVDIAADIGTPIHAVGDGEVTISGYVGDYGQWIRIRHPDGRTSEYGHMYRRDVSVGDHVTAGQQIALMGAEGNADGSHLHLRIWGDDSFSYGIDPELYLAEGGITLPCVPGSGPHPRPLVYPAESGRVVAARSADGRLELFAAGADGVHH